MLKLYKLEVVPKATNLSENAEKWRKKVDEVAVQLEETKNKWSSQVVSQESSLGKEKVNKVKLVEKKGKAVSVRKKKGKFKVKKEAIFVGTCHICGTTYTCPRDLLAHQAKCYEEQKKLKAAGGVYDDDEEDDDEDEESEESEDGQRIEDEEDRDEDEEDEEEEDEKDVEDEGEEEEVVEKEEEESDEEDEEGEDESEDDEEEEEGDEEEDVADEEKEDEEVDSESQIDGEGEHQSKKPKQVSEVEESDGERSRGHEIVVEISEDDSVRSKTRVQRRKVTKKERGVERAIVPVRVKKGTKRVAVESPRSLPKETKKRKGSPGYSANTQMADWYKSNPQIERESLKKAKFGRAPRNVQAKYENTKKQAESYEASMNTLLAPLCDDDKSKKKKTGKPKKKKVV
jgi:hypothetical protein